MVISAAREPMTMPMMSVPGDFLSGAFSGTTSGSAEIDVFKTYNMWSLTLYQTKAVTELNIPASTSKETGTLKKKKKFQVQGEIIPQSQSKLRLAKL